MTSILDLLGLDEETLTWQDLAVCQGIPTNSFYEEYEQDETVARVIDDTCLSCPVMKQCLRFGTENNEWGVWGGVYLTSGTADSNRNKHKTPEIWAMIRERIGE